MILYLARHGESLFNAEGRIQGQSNVPLSDTGRRQSEALAAALAGNGIEAVYSSPLERAYQTAVPVAEALGLEVRIDDRLKEINAGIFQGHCWAEIDANWPDEAARWRSHDPDFVIPQGESRRQLMARGQDALEAIREAGHERALVVAHGGLLTAALKAVLGVPAERNPFSLYNAAISTLRWEGEYRLITLNQLDHLRTGNGALVGHLGDL